MRAIVSSSFSPQRVFLHGYNRWLKTGAMAGVNSAVGAVSFFIRPYDNASSGLRYLYAPSGNCAIWLLAGDQISIRLSDGTNTITGVSTYQFLAANPEQHCVIDWDTSAGPGLKKLKLFVDGVDTPLTITDTDPGFVVASRDASNGRAGCQPGTNGSLGYAGALRELMAWFGETPNFPDAISELRTSAGEPKDCGQNGEYLSVRPDMYLSLRGSVEAKSFAQNRGKSGGDVSYESRKASHDRIRVVGYGDSNMHGAGTTPYLSKITELTSSKIIDLNLGVTGAGLDAIRATILNGATSTNPFRSAETSNIAFIKANWPDAVFVVQGGGNSLPTTSGVGETAATMTAKIVANVDALLSSLPDARFIVQGITTRVGSETGTWMSTVLHETNAAVSAIYGGKFIDIDTYLRSDQAFVAAGISKTAQDITDLANGIVPASFRGDNVHLNQRAHDVITPQVFTRMQSLGYF